MFITFLTKHLNCSYTCLMNFATALKSCAKISTNPIIPSANIPIEKYLKSSGVDNWMLDYNLDLYSKVWEKNIFCMHTQLQSGSLSEILDDI